MTVEKEREIVQQIDKSLWNKSVYFLLPMIGLTSRYIGIINSYLGDNLNRQEENFSKVFVLLTHRDDRLKKYTYYNSMYELEDNTFMYVFDVPEHFQNDYMLFCAGKYSLFSDRYKELLIKSITKRPFQEHFIYKVLYRTLDQKEYIEELVGAELLEHEEVYSRPDLDAEVYG